MGRTSIVRHLSGSGLGGANLRGWALLGGLAVAAAVQPLACNGAGPEPEPVSEALRALLGDVGPAVVMPAIDRATPAAAALATAARAWQAALTTGDGAAERLAAQVAWADAMDVWQELEVLQVGPAGGSLDVVGGQDLRDIVYSWPTVNPCRVDQVTAEAGYASATFLDDNLVNVYGLDALETLLFADDAANACGPEVDINATGAWAALGADEVRSRRAAYAVVAADGVVDAIAALAEAWSPDGDDFSGAIATAGDSGSPYASADDALDDVFAALFYLELETKDRKLAEPLGLADCASTCPAGGETLLAGGSNRWIAANLRGFRALFTGGDGAGMDDLLASVDEQDIVDAVITALDAADAAAAALDEPVEVAASTDPTPALAVYDAVRAVTDLLKQDVATALVLSVPSDADGDND